MKMDLKKINFTKSKLIISIISIIYLLIFAFLFIKNQNYEFLAYVVVIFALMAVLFILNLKFNFSRSSFVGLSVLFLLHMLGGHLIIDGVRLYGHHVALGIRFDKLIHLFGTYIGTLIAFELLRPYLKDKLKNSPMESMFLILIGIGIGAVYEILEFILVLALPETGVGGYVNTMGDIIADSVGACLAVTYLNIKLNMKSKKPAS